MRVARGRCTRSLTSTTRRLPASCNKRAVLAAFSNVLPDSGSILSAVSGIPAFRARSRITAASEIGPAPPPDIRISGAAPSRYNSIPTVTRRRNRSLGRPPENSRQPSTTIASALSWFRRPLGSAAGSEPGQALLHVHDRRLSRYGRRQMKIEFGGIEGPGDAEPARFRIWLLVLGEIADQRVLDREHRIALQILVGSIEDMRRDRLVALGRYDKMNMRWPPGMPPGRLQHAPDRPVRRDGVVDRQHGADQVAPLGVAAELTPHVQFVRVRVLRVIKPV